MAFLSTPAFQQKGPEPELRNHREHAYVGCGSRLGGITLGIMTSRRALDTQWREEGIYSSGEKGMYGH